MTRPLALIAALAALTSAPLVAQQPRHESPRQRCRLEFENRPQSRLVSVKQPGGQYHSFIGGRVVAHCRAQGQTLVADSAEYYGDRRLLVLIGNVHYTEPRATLDSRRLSYWMNEERIRAEGDVNAVLPSGTAMRGPVADYYRAVPGVRTASRLVAPNRPTITLVQRDSAGQPSEPMSVVANTVVSEADSLVYASGKVEVRRSDLIARSDSATMDRGGEKVRLIRQPTIDGRGKRPFTLSGTVIDLFARDRKIERVLSAGEAKALSDDVTLTADTLDFRLEETLLSQAYGWGSSRARADSPTYDIVADSLDVRMPGQRLREVRALRNALAQSTPDTSRIKTEQRDWLRGDTIVALFDSSTSADSAGQPAMQQLVARGGAQSLFQIAAADTTATGPAINYVRGRDITVAFANREVQRVTVEEKAGGVYLEPTLRSAPPPVQPQAPADTLSRRRRRP